ncbi:MAG: tyrosine-protein phosphatase [Oligoflexia bacterium]|nr:tyrosine-protein phosphatase [Oligoflexia bacterium]
MACATQSFASQGSSQASLPGFVIDNFFEVTPKLYRGANPGSAGIAALEKMGIKTIIDLQGGDLDSGLPYDFIALEEPGELPANIAAERDETTHHHMQFLNSPLDSLREITPAEDFDIDMTLGVMADPESQPVYIHCQHGKDRTGLLVALYEVKYLGYSVEQAHEDMEEHGHDGLEHIVTHEMDSYFYKKAPQLTNR